MQRPVHRPYIISSPSRLTTFPADPFRLPLSRYRLRTGEGHVCGATSIGWTLRRPSRVALPVELLQLDVGVAAVILSIFEPELPERVACRVHVGYIFLLIDVQ
jgi:hypothetical protein